MNREELPQEASREDKMRDALKHYEELATKACWHLSAIPDAIRAYYASLPPAEGAEQRIRVRNILQDFYRRGEYELEQAEEDIMRLFQPQPTAEGAEEILIDDIEAIADKYEIVERIDDDPDTGDMRFVINDQFVELVRVAAVKFATLHAQRIADKMVGERLRGKYVFTYEELRKVCCDFFRSWWNTPGSNTDQGFDAWALKTGLKK